MASPKISEEGGGGKGKRAGGTEGGDGGLVTDGNRGTGTDVPKSNVAA